jgi:hypothetical protein
MCKQGQSYKREKPKRCCLGDLGKLKFILQIKLKYTQKNSWHPSSVSGAHQNRGGRGCFDALRWQYGLKTWEHHCLEVTPLTGQSSTDWSWWTWLEEVIDPNQSLGEGNGDGDRLRCWWPPMTTPGRGGGCRPPCSSKEWHEGCLRKGKG